MEIDEELRDLIQGVIEETLGDRIDAVIGIESIEVIESKAEIRIVVRIETTASPDQLAERYFGLTGRVRESLGDKWKNFFPIITPNFDSPAHA